jgi:transcriptional regulator with XRE-family HTH domain
MSMQFVPFQPTSDSEYFKGVWGRFFGKFIESGREKAGLSIEQAATLAGIGVEEWTAIEAGASLPTTRQQFRSIADALDIEWVTMTKIVLMCRQAWGLK